MKKAFSLIEILVSLLLATIVLAGISFVFNQAFLSLETQKLSLNLATDELNNSVNAWKGASLPSSGSEYDITDITTSTLPSTFTSLGNYMKIYRVTKKTPFGTLSYKILAVSK